jgi:large subunit ribosomal protein L19
MQKKIIEFNKEQRSKKFPDFQSGDVVKVSRKIKEGDKERIQIFEGLIIAVKGKQSSSPMITVRKVSNGVGVELILPIFSPSIDKIELVKRAKVRRAKLYYLRGLTAKKSRMKYKDVAEFIPEEEAAAPAAVEAEAVAEEKTEKAKEA